MIYESNTELMHHGVKGMKWGVRRENLYSQNKKISSDFRNSKGRRDSYEKTMAYAGNKMSQYYLRKKDRAKMHEDINNPSKNRGLSIAKAFVKTYFKDLGTASIPAATVGIGSAFLTGNPILGIAASNIVANASGLGILGTRIYNMAKNK